MADTATAAEPAAPVFIPFPGLLAYYGIPYTRVHIARLIKRGEFPPPRRLSDNRIAWRRDELDAYVASRPVAEPKPAAKRARTA